MWTQIDDNTYKCDNGEIIRREFGIVHPAPYSLIGEWVYRNSKSEFIDFNQWRHDLFDKYNIDISSINSLF